MNGSETEPVHAVAIDQNGESIVSGGGDMVVRLWSYDEGYCFRDGHGHGGCIKQVAVSPDSRTIVSVGAEGGIFIWDNATPSPLGQTSTS